jgi:hypothetical protein
MNLSYKSLKEKSHHLTLIYLLLNVKKVFNHVALKQVVKILIKLKISVKMFLTKLNY